MVMPALIHPLAAPVQLAVECVEFPIHTIAFAVYLVALTIELVAFLVGDISPVIVVAVIMTVLPAVYIAVALIQLPHAVIKFPVHVLPLAVQLRTLAFYFPPLPPRIMIAACPHRVHSQRQTNNNKTPTITSHGFSPFAIAVVPD
jgi:hypothetical protein